MEQGLLDEGLGDSGVDVAGDGQQQSQGREKDGANHGNQFVKYSEYFLLQISFCDTFKQGVPCTITLF